jgi:hypothetical protein
MPEATNLLKEWTDFYVIVGSSAGALTGLQFVVIALIAEAEGTRSMLEIRAFGTPTIVHFCAVLLVSGITSAPWQASSSAAWCLGICGTAGVAYTLNVIRHARRQTGYTPDREDWFWYIVLPLVSYATLFAAAVVMAWHPADGLFVLAAAALTLLFNGIHNAWDTVTFIAIQSREQKEGAGMKKASGKGC